MRAHNADWRACSSAAPLQDSSIRPHCRAHLAFRSKHTSQRATYELEALKGPARCLALRLHLWVCEHFLPSQSLPPDLFRSLLPSTIHDHASTDRRWLSKHSAVFPAVHEDVCTLCWRTQGALTWAWLADRDCDIRYRQPLSA
jgi:hypothetical protein